MDERSGSVLGLERPGRDWTKEKKGGFRDGSGTRTCGRSGLQRVPVRFGELVPTPRLVVGESYVARLVPGPGPRPGVAPVHLGSAPRGPFIDGTRD